MNILINAFSARLGGGQTYLKNLLANLPDMENLDILVYAPSTLPLPEDRRIRRGSTWWPTTNPLMRTMWEMAALPRILVREQSQVLFCPGGVIATRAPVNVKTITMFRNMVPFDPAALARIPFGLQRIRNFLLRRAMLRSMTTADLTIFISDYARRIIEALRPIPNPVTIPHGISENFKTHALQIARPPWLPRSEYLLYVSRFEVYKHQREVVEAFCMLPEELRSRYKLLLIGEVNAERRQELSELGTKHDAAHQVIVFGPAAYADLPAAYHHATLNLFASSCENCPNILLEALGAGRPVLSSDVMPMPEFGSDALTYFSPHDPVSIRDALCLVLQDELRQARLGKLAANRSGDFDWAQTSHVTWQRILTMVTQ